MAPDADATAGASQGWHDLEAVLAEEPAATFLAAYLAAALGTGTCWIGAGVDQRVQVAGARDRPGMVSCAAFTPDASEATRRFRPI